MFTTTFTIDRHIEELRAELRGTADTQEAHCIRTDPEAMLTMRDDLIRDAETAI